MNLEKIVVANLKCNGCATTIKDELLSIAGVHNVDVDLAESCITVSCEDVDRGVLTGMLHSLGYPEATEKNGLLLQLKSYSSCMIGKIKNI